MGVSIIDLYFLSTQQTVEVKQYGTERKTAMVLIKEIKNEWITFDLVIDSEEKEYDRIEMNISSVMDYSSNEYFTKLTSLQYSVNVLNPESGKYLRNYYLFEDIKMKLPPASYLFPFKNYQFNLTINPLRDNQQLELSHIGVQEYSGWMKLIEVNNGRVDNVNDPELDVRFHNTVYIESGYPFTLKILFFVIFIGLFACLLIVQLLIMRKEKLDINSVGLILAILIGLPSINSLAKFSVEDSLTFIDTLTISLYLLTISTFFLIIIKQAILLKASKKKLNTSITCIIEEERLPSGLKDFDS